MMTKKIYFVACLLAVSTFLNAQQIIKKNNLSDHGPTLILTPKNFHVSQPVRNMPVCDDLSTFDGFIVPKDGHNTSATMSDKRTRKLNHLKSAGKSSTQTDPLLSTSYQALHQTQTRAPLTSFEGIGLDASPPDPSMAVGPNHVVTMENGVWAVYDKNGTIAPSFPKPLNQPLSGPNHANNAGDPVVMYDREADRWFISQFQLSSANVFLIGISVTPDPTGAYYVYEYELGAGNDYPHYGVWGDSYVTAGNFSGAQKVYTFNRTKMLAGDSSAEIAGFSPANLGASGFAAPIPVHSEAAGAATGAIKIVYYQDDAFSGVSSDHIGMWNIDMDWSDINNSSISGKIEIPTAAFDAAIAGGFANLQQPGTSQRIDAIVGAVMNMSHWYKFDTYESILLNWVVEITNGSQVSGIRWVELRSTNNGGSWSVYQEGTFTDPTGNDSVFMGCIAMDKQGNIGLGYTKTGANTFPSLYYTGRMANDPLGTMTVAEDLVIAGTHSVTNNDRYGDYGQGVRDPSDDLTFWVTSEYSGSQGATNCCNGDRKVRVYSFKLGTDYDDDVAITAITNPVSGAGLSSTQSVTVTIANTGLNTQSNIPVTLSLDGAQVASEVFTGSISGGSSTSYTFLQTIDVSTVGQEYIIEACTDLSGDQATSNDCITSNITNLLGVDLSVIDISSPSTNVGLTNSEDVIFILENIGGQDQSNIPLSIVIDDGSPINATYAGPLVAGDSVTLTLEASADVSATGAHTICVTVNQTADQDTSNDVLCVNLINLDCAGGTTGGCNIDGIKKLVLGTINIDDGGTGCNTENDAGIVGYANRTYLSTDLDRALGLNIHDLQAQTGYSPEDLRVWIDFNDNGLFEAGELMIDDSFTSTNQLNSFTLSIPSNASIGSHVMRCKAFDSASTGAPTDPCGDFQYGETHDYTVNIIDTSLACNGLSTTWNGLNWSNGVPQANTLAIIEGPYDTTTGSLDACALQVDASLTVAGDTYINIDGDITINPTGSLTVAHTGSVVQVQETATTTNNGTISVLVDTPDLDVLDFMIMGSPMSAETRESVWASAWNVQDHTTANFNSIAGITGFNFQDEELDDWNLYVTGVLSAGEGYLVRPQDSYNGAGGVFNYDFNTGTLNSGAVTQTLDFNVTDLESPNMLSNPYASAIDADAFLAANPEFDALYFWEHNLAPSPSYPGANTNGNNYSMDDVSLYNALGGTAATSGGAAPNGVISTGQGFGVFATAAGTATFNNAMRLTTGNTTSRNNPISRDRLWLNVNSTVYNVSGNTLLGFVADATQGVDSKYDNGRVASKVSLYSHIQGSDRGYAIQAREAFEDSMTISLGFSSIIEEVTSYKISLSDFDGEAWLDATPYLVDNQTGVVTNLMEDSYSFTSDMGEFNDRFEIVFQDRSLGSQQSLASSIAMYPNPASDVVTIASPTAAITMVAVRDIRGRLVLNKAVASKNVTTVDVASLDSTLYLVTITTDSGSLTSRLLLK